MIVNNDSLHASYAWQMFRELVDDKFTEFARSVKLQQCYLERVWPG
jgi:hypothetical protein